MVAHGFTIDMLVKLSLADLWARIEKRWGVLYGEPALHLSADFSIRARPWN